MKSETSTARSFGSRFSNVLPLGALVGALSCCLSLLSGCVTATTEESAEVATTTSDALQAGSFLDPRDGQSYPLVKIGAATWFAENLAFNAPGSFCYGDQSANCVTYGRLYPFTAALTACPSGTRLPSDLDWQALESALGMPAADLDLSGYSVVRGTDQGTQLKVGGSTGFGVLPAGYRFGTAYYALGDRTYLWTSTSSPGGQQALRRRISALAPTVFRFNNQNTGFAISARCVVD